MAGLHRGACGPSPSGSRPAPRPLLPAPPWQRVLALRLDNLGDLLMTTPALAAVRHTLPQAQITLLCSPSAAAAAPHLQMIDAAWPFAAPWVAQPADDAAAEPTGVAEAALLERLRAARFDAALIFTVCTQSALPAALLCRMAGIPVRVAHSRENPYGLLSHWLPEVDTLMRGAGAAAATEPAPSPRHEVQRQLDLVAALGLHTPDERLRFTVHESDRCQAALQLQAAGLPAGVPYVVPHPGATAASRRWPAAHFGQAAAPLAARGMAVVFAGGAADTARAAEALQQCRALQPQGLAVSLAGRQSLGELAALIEAAEVLVANNSAAAHLAAALGTPVVDLYALTNPQHTPWRVASQVLSHDVPCRWCLKSVCPEGHHACLRGVAPKRATDAALELMHAQAQAAQDPDAQAPAARHPTAARAPAARTETPA